MRNELEIYEKLQYIIREYLYEQIINNRSDKLIVLKSEIKILCWVLDRMDLYKELQDYN